MWVNFKSDSNASSDKTNKLQVHNSLSRQNSRTSRKSNSSTSQLQKKIEEYCFKTNTEEWKKQQEYKERRRKRKQLKKKLKAEMKMKSVRMFHIPAVILMLFGVVLTIGACTRSVSEGTFIWEYREVVRIIGPIVLTVGIVLLMIAVAVHGYIRKQIKMDDSFAIQPFIHPDFHLQRHSISRHSSGATSFDADDSYNPLIRRDSVQPGCKWYECAHFSSTIKSDDSFWSSSTTSNTTSDDFHHGAIQWENIVAVRIPEESAKDFNINTDARPFEERRSATSIAICNVHRTHGDSPNNNLKDHTPKPGLVYGVGTHFFPEYSVDSMVRNSSVDAMELQYLQSFATENISVV